MDSTTSSADKADEMNISTRRRYTRDQLFSLAKSMKIESKNLLTGLEKFENPDRSKYELDVLDKDAEEYENKAYSSMRSFSNYGRQNSEFGHESFTSLSDHRQQNREVRRSVSSHKTQRLSRMTSSPSIKYNNNNIIPSGDFHNDNISSQVKAKYAKLIETFSGSDSHSTLNYRSARPSVSKTMSNNSFSGSNNKLAERPTSLFGPLRREMPPKYNEKRYSDESMSLPYMPTNTHDNYATCSNSGKKGFGKVLDDSVPPPIKRIGALNKTSSDSVEGAKIEDDDFDITSLLSITVLSDIKTIRHENSYRHVNSSSKDYESPIRPLTRAKTATDFTYQNRQNYAGNSTQSRNFQEHSSQGDSYRFPRSEVDSHTWSHKQNSFETREMAHSSHVNLDISKGSKPLDESTAQIIETFKAQVKARATAKEVEAKAIVTSSTGSQSSSDQSQTGEKACLVTSDSVVNEPKKALATSDETTIGKSEATNVVSEEKHSQQTTSISEVLPSVSENKRSPATTKEKQVTGNISNIPRLICLHKPKFSNSVLDSIKEKESNVSTRHITSKLSETKNVSCKIDSQYKKLRGKSLADEVEEIAK